MGIRARPIVGTTPAGAGTTYIVVDRYASSTTIQLTVNGTVTDYDLDFTLDDIASPTGVVNAVANAVAPTDAAWTETTVNQATGSEDLTLVTPVFAFRIVINTGTGSISYRIVQSE